jgi:glycosyltransferase involved in cell wall biosynthesis
MALQTLLTGRLPSLQCLLFCDFHNHRQLLARLRETLPDTLYCDGVRTFYFLKRMGPFRKQMRIVVDFDDLMSLRMHALSTTKTSLSLGYLNDKIPRRLRSMLALGVVSRFIARYEQAALTNVENLIGQWADVVVLVSQVEGQALRSRYERLGYQAQVRVIPPAVEVVAPPRIYESVSRFIFIGTDALPQNKLTIQLLLDLWQLAEPELEIHIFGHMTSQWTPVRGVVFRDYAPDLQDVYAKDVVLLAPGVLRGGLKTKVAEAFAHGCAVIGNEITFEGMHLPDYPLKVEREEELVDILKFPLSYLHRMSASAEAGQQYIRNFVNRQQFQESWADVLG